MRLACPNSPIRHRRRSFASGDSATWAALRHHKRADKAALQEPSLSSPVFQSPEQYGHSPRAKCSSATAPSASRYLLARVSFPLAIHANDLRSPYPLLRLNNLFDLLFRFHKTHRNADHPPHNLRLARVGKTPDLAFRARVRNCRYIAILHLAPAADILPSQ